jgi:hypothetical protein
MTLDKALADPFAHPRRGAAPSRRRKSLRHESQGQSRLYRRFFTAEEIRRLDATPADSLASEIHALRLLLARVLAATERIKLTLKQRLSMLTAFCRVALTLASLVRFEFKQQPAPPTVLDLLTDLWGGDIEDL